MHFEMVFASVADKLALKRVLEARERGVLAWIQ
jgi:hypothetical protein